MTDILRSTHKPAIVPLTKGIIFSPLPHKEIIKKKKNSSDFQNIISDFQQLLTEAVRIYTKSVDLNFSNADFLDQDHIAGSNINKDTKLSFILRTCFGLSQMTLKPDIIENYRYALKAFLNQIQHKPRKKILYTQLIDIIHTYESFIHALEHEALIRNELNRLINLNLSPKTIDRRLKIEWYDICIQQPIEKVTQQITQSIQSNPSLQSGALLGCINSLLSLARLFTSQL